MAPVYFLQTGWPKSQFSFRLAYNCRDGGKGVRSLDPTFVDAFSDGQSRFVWAHWDGTGETEKAIKDATKATIRCLPLEGEGPESSPGECIKTGAPSAQRVLFAKNY